MCTVTAIVEKCTYANVRFKCDLHYSPTRYYCYCDWARCLVWLCAVCNVICNITTRSEQCFVLHQVCNACISASLRHNLWKQEQDIQQDKGTLNLHRFVSDNLWSDRVTVTTSNVTIIGCAGANRKFVRSWKCCVLSYKGSARKCGNGG